MRKIAMTMGVGLGITMATVVVSADENDPYDMAESEARKERAAQKAADADTAMEKGDFATGCKLFEASIELDPKPGTKFALAECLANMGLFKDAYYYMLGIAREVEKEGAADSAKYARETAELLRKKAPCIVINVGKNLQSIQQLKVELDGTAIPEDAWSRSCIPVNLGYHRVLPRAPEYEWAPIYVETLLRGVQKTVVVPPPIKVPLPPMPKPQESANGAGAWILGILGAAAIVNGALVTYKAQDAKSLPLAYMGSALWTGGGVFITSAIAVKISGSVNPQALGGRYVPTNLNVGITGQF